MDADLERRFGGLRRLYGDAGYARLRAAHVAVVGVGGVGSWVAEALARSGVAALTLIDLDQVSESNINRQVQATSHSVGQAKVLALAERIASIHPGCAVRQIEEFVEADNWPGLLGDGPAPDVVVDACDQVAAKLTLATWALRERRALVCVGAAGGKRSPHLVQVADLAEATHDPLLASLRQRLRKLHGAPARGRMGLRAVFSRENVVLPVLQACEPAAIELGAVGIDQGPSTDGTLNCHGYGSTVTVTATFGLVAAAEAIECVLGTTVGHAAS